MNKVEKENHKNHRHKIVEETEGHTLNGLAPIYDWLVKLISLGRDKRMRNRSVELACICEGDAVLEVGCGTGSLTLAAKECVGAAGRVVGTDPSSRMIEIARKKAHDRGFEVDFQMGVIEQIAFPGESFDVVLSSLMMHHLPDEALKRAGISETYRVLKPAGRLAIIDMEPTQWSLVGLVHGQTAPNPNSPIRKLAGLMEEAGFTNVEIHKIDIRGIGFVMGTK